MPVTAKTPLKVGGKRYSTGETIPDSAFANYTKEQLAAVSKYVDRPKTKKKAEDATS
jgi:hypothetical protein